MKWKEDFVEYNLDAGTDLGWLYNLPPHILYRDEEGIVLLGEVIQYISSYNGLQLEECVGIIEGDALAMQKIDWLRNGIVKDYEDAKSLVDNHSGLFKQYRINCVEADFKRPNGLWIMFESGLESRIFEAYYGSDLCHDDNDRIINSLAELVDRGQKGVKDFKNWSVIRKLFERYDIDTYKEHTFKVKKNKIILIGRGWGSKKDSENERRLYDVCKTRKGKRPEIDFSDGLEGLEMFLDLITVA